MAFWVFDYFAVCLFYLCLLDWGLFAVQYGCLFCGIAVWIDMCDCFYYSAVSFERYYFGLFMIGLGLSDR